jgi:hypothetical protein
MMKCWQGARWRAARAAAASAIIVIRIVPTRARYASDRRSLYADAVI